MNSEHYPFTLMPLPYPYDALEPYVDTETMHFHHDKHHKAYVDNLNKALAPYPQYHNLTLEQLIMSADRLDPNIQKAVKNNAGGVYNHNLYWSIMSPKTNHVPQGLLSKAIDSQFQSFFAFQEAFKKEALGRFGSGYAWLVTDNKGKLKIISTANQDTTLPLDYCPLLLIDVWEHAYYLKYQNRRNEYIDEWWNTVNWDQAQENHGQCLTSLKNSKLSQLEARKRR